MFVRAGTEEEGTLFVPEPARLRGRKRWIAFFHHPGGTLRVDEGAGRALREQGKSLLFPGIREVAGEFGKGEVVRITDLNGSEFARGVSAFSSRDLREGEPPRRAVVHRDQLVIL